jgi:hypothetical protein
MAGGTIGSVKSRAKMRQNRNDWCPMDAEGKLEFIPISNKLCL